MTKLPKVVGHRLLVKILGKEDMVGLSDFMKESGFVVSHEIGEERREKIGAERGVVLAVGPMCWKHRDYGFGLDGWEPWCKVGDTILFAKYAGKLYEDPNTKEEFFLLDDEAVQLVIEEAKNA